MSQRGGKKRLPKAGGSSTSTVSLANLVQTVSNVTGVSEEQARQVLDACDNDVNAAVNAIMEGGLGATQDEPSLFQDIVSEAESGPDTRQRSPIPPHQGVLVDPTFPTRRLVVNTSCDRFRDFAAETRQQEAMLASREGVAPKRMLLSDLYSAPVDLICGGTFEEVKKKGAETNKWLLVSVYHSAEFVCLTTNRDVWKDERVQELVKQYFIFWQVMAESDQGQHFIQFYPVKEWPCTSILDPRTGEVKVTLNLSDPDEMFDALSEFIKCHDSPDGTKVEVKDVDDLLNYSEEEQIQIALAVSLKETSYLPKTFVCNDIADSEDENNTESSSNSTMTEETPVSKGQESTAGEMEDAAQFSDPGHDVSDENPLTEESQEDMNVTDNNESTMSINGDTSVLEMDEGTGSISICFRAPDDLKFRHVFQGTATVQDVSAFVESKSYPPATYNLVTTYPHRRFDQLSPSATLQSLGFQPQEVVFIQET